MKNLLTVTDLSRKEVEEILNIAGRFKEERREGIRNTNILAGKSILLYFEKPSTRTRVSLEVAILELGGHPIMVRKEELQLVRGESIADTARVLSKYVDAIIARVYKHEFLEELAKYSTIPVINALSDLYHPLQAIADVFTIKEYFGRLKGVRVAFIGDGGSNVAHSLILISALLGLDITVACPEKYSPGSTVLKKALLLAEKSGAEIKVVDDPVQAVKDADVVYTDVFVSMGFEREREERLKIFLPKYQVNRNLLKNARRRIVFMHCLPAHRGEEVASEVLDDETISLVFRQAENRLHTAKAVLAHIFGVRI
ncbi:MAG: ornithine carbamoyltransferase [Thermoprotei archaeon]|nr:MAG: ornithine carbamoyltransferase [Thermoprotei archaeon]RLE82870.1 MAG: ornithine carbamoyltransferase [Thermoprotei archaeon]